MFRRAHRILFVMLLVSSFGYFSVHAQANIYKLHSLFLYNFTKHIQWKEVGNNFTIGVFGSDIAFLEIKKNLAGKKFLDKDIRVINIVGIGDANASQVVYMPRSAKSKILNMFEVADKKNTLFVSEDDLISEGFSISFILDGNKLNFKVSRKNLDASSLKISSSLLSLAEVVD